MIFEITTSQTILNWLRDLTSKRYIIFVWPLLEYLKSTLDNAKIVLETVQRRVEKESKDVTEMLNDLKWEIVNHLKITQRAV